MVAVEDADAVTRQQVLAGPAQRRDEAVTAAGDGPDQLGRDVEFDVLELLVDALEGDGDALAQMLVGRLDVGGGATNDQAHDIDGRREQQLAGIAAFGRAIKQGVEGRGRQRVFQGGARHHAEGAVVDKTLEDRPQDHNRLRAAHARSRYPELSYKE